MNDKLVTLSQLTKIAASCRRCDQRNMRHQFVLACGCFDLLHLGHVRHLQLAARWGQVLAVLLTSDEHVAETKGPGRPVFTVDARAEMLAALQCVDYITINDGPDIAEATVDAIRLIRPHIYVKGKEYRGNEPDSLLAQKTAVEDGGGRFIYLDTEAMHTSEILAKLRGPQL